MANRRQLPIQQTDPILRMQQTLGTRLNNIIQPVGRAINNTIGPQGSVPNAIRGIPQAIANVPKIQDVASNVGQGLANALNNTATAATYYSPTVYNQIPGNPAGSVDFRGAAEDALGPEIPNNTNDKRPPDLGVAQARAIGDPIYTYTDRRILSRDVPNTFLGVPIPAGLPGSGTKKEFRADYSNQSEANQAMVHRARIKALRDLNTRDNSYLSEGNTYMQGPMWQHLELKYPKTAFQNAVDPQNPRTGLTKGQQQIADMINLRNTRIQQLQNDLLRGGQPLVGPTYEGQEYKKGGMVKQTGMALVHKGEYVVPKNKVDKMEGAAGRMNRLIK